MPEQDHARQDVQRKGAVDGRGREQQQPQRGTESPTTSGFLIPKRMTRFAESPSEKPPMIKLVGRKASPTSSGL